MLYDDTDAEHDVVAVYAAGLTRLAQVEVVAHGALEAGAVDVFAPLSVRLAVVAIRPLLVVRTLPDR